MDITGDLELVQVHVVARHGDRSPVSEYVLGDPVFYDCGLVDSNRMWTGLRDFPPLQGLQYEGEAILSLHQSLHPGFDSKLCGVGKLTGIGFHQHAVLGSQMSRKYARSLFGNVTEERTARYIYVQSTDFARTIQSAASFMLGFLPNQRKLRKRVTIHVSPGETLAAPPPGIEQVFKPCRRYSSFHKAELAKSGYLNTEKTKYHPLLEQLCHMFGLHQVQNKPIVTKLFDSIATRGCHARDDPLPCFEGQCLDYDFALKLFNFSDWAFTHACTKDSSLVGQIPFLRHSILGLMEAVTRGERKAKRFVLSLTHDLTITRLLLALGIQLESWMPYGSRVTFELWRAKVASPKTDAFKLRVLFNGKPITQHLAAWEGSHDTIHTPSDLLPYELWKSYLETGRFRDTESYNHVCGNF